MTEQTAAEFYAQVNGTVEALVLAFGALAATHPQKEKVMELVTKLSSHASENPADSAEIRSYKLGIRKAVATLAESVKTAQLAAEIHDLKLQTGSH